MFDVNKLEKEDLIEYIKKLDDVMDKKDRYIEALEERIYEQERLNNMDAVIKEFQSSLRAALVRMDRFEQKHNYKKPAIIDLNEDKETDKVKEPKFQIGDVVECPYLSGKYVVHGYHDSSYLIRNVENNNEYTATAETLYKIPEEEK